MCLLLLPDGCCCRYYYYRCAAIPCWAIARLCPGRRCCCCVLLLPPWISVNRNRLPNRWNSILCTFFPTLFPLDNNINRRKSSILRHPASEGEPRIIVPLIGFYYNCMPVWPLNKYNALQATSVVRASVYNKPPPGPIVPTFSVLDVTSIMYDTINFC